MFSQLEGTLQPELNYHAISLLKCEILVYFDTMGFKKMYNWVFKKEKNVKSLTVALFVYPLIVYAGIYPCACDFEISMTFCYNFTIYGCTTYINRPSCRSIVLR